MSIREAGIGGICSLAAALVLLSGCGGGDDSGATSAASPSKAQSEQEIKAVIADFYSDDNPAKCDTLSDRAIESMGSLDACLNNDAPATQTDYDLKSFKIAGDRATVHLIAETSP